METECITFHDDLNIYYIYDSVIALLKSYVSNRDSYEKEYEILKKISLMSHNPTDRSRAIYMIREMDKLLPLIRDKTLPEVYMKRVAPYLYEYNNLCGYSRVFGMDKCPNIPKRVGTIISFLEVTKEYTKITYSCSYNMDKICSRCYSKMKKCGPIMVCNACGYTHKIENVPGIMFDGMKIRTESTYDAPKNFRKEYMHLCGIIHDMKDGEKEDIESYLYRAGFKHPTRENIRDGIRACGYNNYHDTNYIHHKITGEPLPYIYAYIDICIDRFEQYFEVFQSLDDKEGHNITNLHFLIKLFLWQENLQYEDCWFRTLSSQTELKHQRNARKVCNVLALQDKERNWKCPSIWTDKK